ncbi:uncharacterized protein LOC122374780 [Amphibalanus amphitrite]|uniref:uncharacterized protein LOC122374780 n=1 Tax=Amphibalanus amphitrite TaxID=1232801 RepID=UPI001C9001EE|nr:uncharacterized protein LOC122374780 [Amphibalanus amphitrite]
MPSSRYRTFLSVRPPPSSCLGSRLFDRLLHFGEHCTNLKRKARPRTTQLRKLTGHSWGLQEHHLRAVANGYVRGAIEYAAAAWLPAASRSHLELVDRELRAAARAVTGCPRSAPTHALMAEAGLPTAEMRRATLATRLLARASALPAGDPLRELAEASRPCRLRNITGWRDEGRRTLDALGVTASQVEPMVVAQLPPWTSSEGITISCAVPPDCVRRRAAVEAMLADLPGAERATWVWSDGLAEGGTVRGGGGALIVLPAGAEWTVKTPAGALCSSTRAELVALRAALEEIAESDLTPDQDTHPDTIIVCLDSRAAQQTVDAGPAAQTSQLGDAIWRLLMQLANRGRRLHLQWVPAHCGLPGNERADMLAMEAAELEQTNAPPPPPGCQEHHPRRRQVCAPIMAGEPARRLVPLYLPGSDPACTVATRQQRGSGGYSPATGRPLERINTVPPPHRPPADPRLPRLHGHRLPCRSVSSVRGGGGHPAARLAALPVPVRGPPVAGAMSAPIC